MVEEWCGGSGGRLIPLCLVPLWDAELAAAEVRRNAARGVRAVCVLRAPAVPRAAEHPLRATGIRSSPRARETGTVVACTSARAPRRSHRPTTRPTRCRPRTSSPTARCRSIDFLFSGVLVRFPDLQAALRRGADRLDPVRARARRRRVGRRTAAGATARTHVSEPPSRTTTARSSAASSRTASASRTSTASGATTSRSRPTTRTRTARGRTRTRWPRSCSATSTPPTVAQDRARQRHPPARPRGARRRHAPPAA